jgi:predicted DNA-binding WGR domain protein
MTNDLELRLVDPAKNRFRLYGMTEARTLFGEPCLLIAWGRIGRKLRRRTETFDDRELLERRWRALVARRRRHGYVEAVLPTA